MVQYASQAIIISILVFERTALVGKRFCWPLRSIALHQSITDGVLPI
jgi:hypothetical protein